MRIKKILPFILLVFYLFHVKNEDFEIETNNSKNSFYVSPMVNKSDKLFL